MKNSSFGPGGQIFSPYRSISLFWQGDRPNQASRVARPRRVVWFTILADFDRICGFDGNLGFSDFGVFQQNKPKINICCSLPERKLSAHIGRLREKNCHTPDAFAKKTDTELLEPEVQGYRRQYAPAADPGVLNHVPIGLSDCPSEALCQEAQKSLRAVIYATQPDRFRTPGRL